MADERLRINRTQPVLIFEEFVRFSTDTRRRFQCNFTTFDTFSACDILCGEGISCIRGVRETKTPPPVASCPDKAFHPEVFSLQASHQVVSSLLTVTTQPENPHPTETPFSASSNTVSSATSAFSKNKHDYSLQTAQLAQKFEELKLQLQFAQQSRDPKAISCVQ